MRRNRILVLTLLMVLLFGCTPSNTQTLTDAELVKLVQKFAEDEGDEGQKTFEQLRSLPRGELISSLSRLRNSLSPTDALHPQIAFVLCYLDQDYQTNVEIVASALSKEPKYRNFDADWAGSLLARLIKRGDKNLLKNLFSAVPWSDGALSEVLAVTFEDEFRNDREAFVEMLAAQPVAVRTRVYELINEKP